MVASAILTGTAVTGGVLESQIVAGTETIIITLTDETWVATIGDDNAFTTALIAGIDSAQSEAEGWDAEVKGNMVHGDVTRTSATVVTIILAAEAAYEITEKETITVTIPAAALTGAAEVVATPTFDVTNQSPHGMLWRPIIKHHLFDYPPHILKMMRRHPGMAVKIIQLWQRGKLPAPKEPNENTL